MSDLCAPLQSLYDEYQRLVDEVHRDPSLAPTASARLAGLTTTDAAGYVWALNESGSWFRAQPGQSYEPADPVLFAISPSPSTPVLAPSPGASSTPPPWASSPIPSPPFSPLGPSTSLGAPPSPPVTTPSSPPPPPWQNQNPSPLGQPPAPPTGSSAGPPPPWASAHPPHTTSASSGGSFRARARRIFLFIPALAVSSPRRRALTIFLVVLVVGIIRAAVATSTLSLPSSTVSVPSLPSTSSSEYCTVAGTQLSNLELLVNPTGLLNSTPGQPVSSSTRAQLEASVTFERHYVTDVRPLADHAPSPKITQDVNTLVIIAETVSQRETQLLTLAHTNTAKFWTTLSAEKTTATALNSRAKTTGADLFALLNKACPGDGV